MFEKNQPDASPKADGHAQRRAVLPASMVSTPSVMLPPPSLKRYSTTRATSRAQGPILDDVSEQRLRIGFNARGQFDRLQPRLGSRRFVARCLALLFDEAGGDDPGTGGSACQGVGSPAPEQFRHLR